MKKIEEILKELPQILPKEKTYWSWYKFCSGLRGENLLNQRQFNLLIQEMREIFLK